MWVSSGIMWHKQDMVFVSGTLIIGYFLWIIKSLQTCRHDHKNCPLCVFIHYFLDRNNLIPGARDAFSKPWTLWGSQKTLCTHIQIIHYTYTAVFTKRGIQGGNTQPSGKAEHVQYFSSKISLGENRSQYEFKNIWTNLKTSRQKVMRSPKCSQFIPWANISVFAKFHGNSSNSFWDISE